MSGELRPTDTSPKRTPEWRAEYASKAASLWSAGKDTYEIGQILGVHESEAYSLLRLWETTKP